MSSLWQTLVQNQYTHPNVGHIPVSKRVEGILGRSLAAGLVPNLLVPVGRYVRWGGLKCSFRLFLRRIAICWKAG
jgi:hypothetical protein